MKIEQTNGWWQVSNRQWEKLGFIITKELWAGKNAFLVFADDASFQAGSNFVTKKHLCNAKEIVNGIISYELHTEAFNLQNGKA